MDFFEQMQNKSIEDCIRSVIEIGLGYTRQGRRCSILSDHDFMYLGVNRIFSQCSSGRDWLQGINEKGVADLGRSTFFEALSSSRRAEMAGDVAGGTALAADRVLADAGVDYLADFPELNGFECYAGDGHTIEHASHAKKIKDKHIPASSIYMLNMRTGTAREFSPVSGDGKRKHEFPVLKRILPDWNRAEAAAAGRIIVYDRAAIDIRFWTYTCPKQNLYLVCRTKSNMKPVFRYSVHFDRNDPVNKGVKGYFMVGYNNASTAYEVDYEDPETGENYTFFSTLPEKIRPGVIAWIYFLRWRIEKMFDNFENDFEERKAWGASNNAQRIHACMLVVAYNISRLILDFWRKNHQITDAKVEHKYEHDIQKRESAARAGGRSIHPLHRMSLQRRMPKLSLQFIRTLRNHIFSTRPLKKDRKSVV